MTNVEAFASPDVLRAPEAEVRGRVFSFGGVGSGPDPGPLHSHQVVALERIEAGADCEHPVSGILHYPTGAGKTRVGLELIARALRRDLEHRFIWATHSKNLVQQSMQRLAELAHVFPARTTFTWVKSASDVAADDDLAATNIVFMTRNALSGALSLATEHRTHPWRRHLEAGAPITLIYDECHQLGADGLQASMERFSETLERARRQSRARRWRVIGLSATPVPTRQESHRVLSKYVFPKRGSSTCHDWPFHVFHRVHNETLVESGVLCNPTDFFDRHGEFDLPEKLLRDVVGEAHLSPPGRDADPLAVQRYAMQFNGRVLSHRRVIEFLADRIGRNIHVLGKSVVFLPSIDAANAMAALLYERFPPLRGSVAAVHSRMDDLRLPGQEGATVQAVLERFRGLHHKPSVLVNVDMLTEGFDDPKIRTVVLARLTLSTNRFWQMIGRGTRGPASKGTTECYVIDPVKLTRVYDYFAGYQPSFSKDDDIELEDGDERDGGEGRIPPHVPLVARPPDPAYGGYRVDAELERVHANLARALRHFLDGGALSEGEAMEVVTRVRVELADGAMVFRPAAEGTFEATTCLAILLGEISNLERRVGVDLGWFRNSIPSTVDNAILRTGLRALRAIESQQLWTATAFGQARDHEALEQAMRQPAVGTMPDAATSASVHATDMSARERAVLDSAIAVALADGALVSAEAHVIAETLRRMFGRAPTEDLVAELTTRRGPTAIQYETLLPSLSASERQLFVLQLAEIAAADGIVTQGERDMLRELVQKLQLPSAFLDAILGAHVASAEAEVVEKHDTIPAPPPEDWASAANDERRPFTTSAQTAPMPARAAICPSCRFVTPAGSLFCPACGTRLASSSSHAPQGGGR